MTRETLPQRRPCESFDIRFAGMDVAVQFGWSDDARIVEVFMSTRKVGTAFDTQVRDLAVLISLGLQYGITPTVMLRSLTMTEDGKPEGLASVIVSAIIERQIQ